MDNSLMNDAPNNGLRMRTERLDLIAATWPMARAAADGDRERFGQLLGAQVTTDWPPEFMEDAQEFVAVELEKAGEVPGWGVWYVVLRDERKLIGCAGIKGEPRDGQVDIGYSVIKPYQRRGYATEATRAVIDWVFRDPRTERVVGETFANLPGSIGVMEKCGMKFVGVMTGFGGEEGVSRYEMRRADWTTR